MTGETPAEAGTLADGLRRSQPVRRRVATGSVRSCARSSRSEAFVVRPASCRGPVRHAEVLRGASTGPAERVPGGTDFGALRSTGGAAVVDVGGSRCFEPLGFSSARGAFGTGAVDLTFAGCRLRTRVSESDHEAHVPALEHSPPSKAWVSKAHAGRKRPKGAGPSACPRPQALGSDHLPQVAVCPCVGRGRFPRPPGCSDLGTSKGSDGGVCGSEPTVSTCSFEVGRGQPAWGSPCPGRSVRRWCAID